MPSTIPVLWSDDISVDVLSPIAILRAQVGPLSQKTKGILEAKIETITNQAGKVQHQFDLVAPVLNQFRRRVLVATHQKDLIYPVVVEAECFLSDDSSPLVRAFDRARPSLLQNPEKLLEGQRCAATDQEFIRLVEEVLRSAPFRLLIHSLIARTNEQNSETEPSDAEGEEAPE